MGKGSESKLVAAEILAAFGCVWVHCSLELVSQVPLHSVALTRF